MQTTLVGCMAIVRVSNFYYIDFFGGEGEAGCIRGEAWPNENLQTEVGVQQAHQILGPHTNNVQHPTTSSI